jgi:cellulose synthase/poly-beta-1,6-N-acetylglucosamine synthase-like glycosyltransferase
MVALAYFILSVYIITLTYITFYCLLEFHLLYHYKRHQSKNKQLVNTTINAEITDFPFVTVQLPIYNEIYVIERLIDCVANFDYPKDRFEIHILDDSTDETLEIVQKKVAEYQAKGFLIAQITRTQRTGYKAGALRDGTPQAKGEFIAIFDADFLPKKDFLKKTIPHFKDEKVGVVQTRWGHINEDYSLLTRLQAIQLNVHFTVEQQGREAGNYLLQFNGTAGVWRKAAIESAGGWEADTLTEDLDLSIRAQLKGWRIVYLEDMDSPAELPADMNGLKSQQFRWMKGGAETAKKMLPTVWHSNLSLGQKIHATGHLLSSTIFFFVFIAGVFSVPLIFLIKFVAIDTAWFAYFLTGLFSIISIHYVSNVESSIRSESYIKKLFKFIILFPVFLSLSMGLSLHNSIAVIQGYLGKTSPFVRTPKFNIQNLADSLSKKKYRTYRLSWTTLVEGMLAIYFLLAIVMGLQVHNTDFILFHFMLFVGYGTIFVYSLRHLSVK